MSLLTDAEQPLLSVAPFFEVPGIVGLSDIMRPSGSTSGSDAGSSDSFPSSVIDRAEPCLITGSILYTNEPVYWINLVHDDEKMRSKIITSIRELRITPPNFILEDASNIAILDCGVHKSLDKYAFIAVTGTRETLTALIDLIRTDNDRRQERFDTRGHDPGRRLDLDEVFQYTQFELVALHPEHFLPGGSALLVYDRPSGTHKTYFPSADRRLRESLDDITSPSIPSFSGPSRALARRMNPLFVVLNAEIKFRRYLRMQAPAIPLPDDVQDLMRMSKELVDLIYWRPIVKPGTEGALAANNISLLRQMNPPRAKRPRPESVVESELEKATDSKRARGQGSPSRGANLFPWPEGADLKTRVEMGSALLSGHDLDYTSGDDELLAFLHSHGNMYFYMFDFQ